MNDHDVIDNLAESDDCLFCSDHIEEAALGILEAEDQERFEHHLSGCSICRAELARLDTAVQLLPFAVNQIEPDAALKLRLHERFLQERDAEPMRIPSPRKSVSRNRNRKAPSRPMWTFGSVFAGFCVALAVIGLWNLLPSNESSTSMSGRNFQVYAMQSSDDQSGGHIGADPDSKDGTMMAWNLDPSEKHEIWCVDHEDNRWKVDDLVVADSGSAMQTVTFPKEISTYKQIYVMRNDGTQELSVAPNQAINGDEPAPSESTPAGD